MKVILLILSIITFPAYSLACPNLAGNYAKCISKSGDHSNTLDVKVQQTTSQSITTYNISAKDEISREVETKTLIADGKTKIQVQNDTEIGLSLNKKETVACKEDALIHTLTIDVNKSQIANITTITKMSGNAMLIQIKGISKDVVVDDLITCK